MYIKLGKTELANGLNIDNLVIKIDEVNLRKEIVHEEIEGSEETTSRKEFVILLYLSKYANEEAETPFEKSKQTIRCSSENMESLETLLYNQLNLELKGELITE